FDSQDTGVQKFRNSTLRDLRSIGIVQPESEVRRRYLLVADLAARAGSRDLTVEQRVNLSAYLIRLRRYVEAIGVLKPVESSRHYMVLANLGMANQLLAEASPARTRDEQQARNLYWNNAVDYLQEALRAWPKDDPGWSKTERERLARHKE